MARGIHGVGGLDILGRCWATLSLPTGSETIQEAKDKLPELPTRSVVKLFVTSAERSYLQPWQVLSESESTGTGFVVKGTRHTIGTGRFWEMPFFDKRFSSDTVECKYCMYLYSDKRNLPAPVWSILQLSSGGTA